MWPCAVITYVDVMNRAWFFLLCGMMPVMAGQMPEKAAGYHEALRKRPESEALFMRFRDAWLEEKPVAELEVELLSRAEAGEPGAWGILGRARLAAGKEDEALAAFGKAIEAEPAAVWLRLARARMLLARKDFATGEKDALAVPEGDKLRPEALKLAGLACLRGERVEEALAHWKKAVEAAPGDKSLLEDLTELTRREGRHDLALDFCAKWRDATDDAYGKAMATLKRSELLLASQRMDEAMSELGEVLKASGDGSWLEREALARAEQAFQRRSDATGWVKQIAMWVDANPVRQNFRRAQAQALAAAGQPAQALDVLGEVLKRVPGDREARWQRVSLLERDLKVQEAFDECAALAAEEKSEETGLRVAELAFRLEKKDEVKKALDAVIAAADPAKRVSLAGLYARYGLPVESEKHWRAAAGGELGGQALRELAKHLRAERREKEALEVWKEIGRRDHSQDRIDAAQALAAAGEKEAARTLLDEGRERFVAEPGHEVARAELALMQGRQSDAWKIFRELAARAKRPDEMQMAAKGWLRAANGHEEEATKELGEETGDRCLRATLLAEKDQPLPALVAGDELERTLRLSLLREHSKWPQLVAMLEASGGSGPLFLSDLLEAKLAAGDRRGALAAAQAWRERTPDQPGPWMKEASLLSASGDVAAAETLLRRATARFEADEDVARALFTLLNKNGDARTTLDYAWQRHDQANDAPAKAGWLREIIRVSKEGNRLDDLKERFEERARRDPASPAPLVALADLEKAKGDTVKELELMTKAVVCAPRDVPIVSRLAALEEQMGRRDRALERYTELARLVPGMDSARQLAQAKLRCGDIAGGVRDLQTLAGDEGIDARALEQSVFAMAARGYLEEGIELLSSLDPSRIDPRGHFVLGMLLEADGREGEALDHFLKVVTEPEDPAEPKRNNRNGRNLLGLIHSYQEFPGAGAASFRYMQLPGSLAEAQQQLPLRIMKLAMVGGAQAWDKATAEIPELKSATVDEWRQVKLFSQEAGGDYSVQWLEFIRRFPDNPLGPELLVESQQHHSCTREQIETLLRRQPPLSPRLALQLHLARGKFDSNNFDWLEQLDPAVWREPMAVERGLAWAGSLLGNMEGGQEIDPEAAAKLERLLSLLDKAELQKYQGPQLHLLRARQALLAGQVEAFLAGVQRAFDATFPEIRPAGAQGELNLGMALFRWGKVKGDAAMESLIERLPSPTLRCDALREAGKDPDSIKKRIVTELAALPANAPRNQRRELIRLKWRYMDRKEDRAGFEKELKGIVDDDSDPRMALEAYVQLFYRRDPDGRRGGIPPAERQRVESLVKRIDTGDESDFEFASQVGQMFNPRQASAPPPPRLLGRWGASANSSSYGYSISSNQGQICRRIVALADRQVAAREAADFLVESARSSQGESVVLREPIEAFRQAGLLDEAIEKIVMPESAGLSRRMAMLQLMDVVGKKAEARSIVAGLHKYRPWETQWAAELAVRTEDRDETFRLLDEIAARPDFVGEFFRIFFNDRKVTDVNRFAVLADWAERPQVNRSWLGPATVVLGGRLGSAGPAAKDWSELYQRYAKMALDDGQSAEMAFRSMYVSMRAKEPAAVEDAARQALLSGAYVAGFEQRNGAKVDMPQAPASIELLVQLAAEKGDEVVFPADFRDKLKAVDPNLAGWLATLLATQRATDLPDVFDEKAMSNPQGGVRVAKHEAAILRASHLAGRDELLEKLFRENKEQSVSTNLTFVIRECLLEASKNKALEKRLLKLLETSAGPRKGWNATDPKLRSASGIVLRSACTSDSTTLVGVLTSFAAWQLQAQENNPGPELAGFWRRDLAEPRKTKWESLPGTSMRDALHLGIWTAQSYDSDGKVRLRFKWIFPEALHYVREDGVKTAAFVEEVAKNPKASFLDLMRVAAMSDDVSFDKRALKLAMPELEKLPAGIRDGVIEVLTQFLDADDLKGLPKQAAATLSKRLDAQREARLKRARQNLDQMKAAGAASWDAGTIGQLVGQVFADDPKLVEELLTLWRSAPPKKQGAQDFDGFMNGLLSGCDKDIDAVFSRLLMIDRLWQGGLPGANSSGSDPFATAWGTMAYRKAADPKVWARFRELSPRMQVRLILGARMHFSSDQAKDETWRKESQAAAKGNPLTDHACRWFLEKSALGNEPETRSDGLAAMGLLDALKAAGATPEELGVFLIDVYQVLPKLDNAADIMKRTPEFLAGCTTLPQNLAGELIERVLGLWGQVQMQRQREDKMAREAGKRTPVYPAETTALFKFILTKLPGGKLERYFSTGQVTSVLLLLDDDEVLDRWIAASRDRLGGDANLVLHFLRKDRLKEAIALLPAPGMGGLSSYTSSPTFSKETEELARKLVALDSPEAFRLRVLISMAMDAREADAPSEARPARLERLAGEFEQRRKSLSRVDRMAMCQDLGLISKAAREHVPALDEFAGEEAAKEFRSRFSGQQPRGDGLGLNLAMSAVQSRFHADDWSGIESLAQAIRQAPLSRQMDELVKQSVIPVSNCFWQDADRRDSKLPEAAAATIRLFATAVATRKDPEIRAGASMLVYLAGSDAASLKAGLEAADLVGVAPARLIDRRFGMRSPFDPGLRAMLRVSVLHPCSEELLKVIERPSATTSQFGDFLSVLDDPAVRARLAPALFLDWTRYTSRVPMPHMAGLKAYATERRADFDESQRVKLDALMERVENPARGLDPEIQKQMEREQREEMQQMQRMQDESRRREMERQRGFNR